VKHGFDVVAVGIEHESREVARVVRPLARRTVVLLRAITMRRVGASASHLSQLAPNRYALRMGSRLPATAFRALLPVALCLGLSACDGSDEGGGSPESSALGTCGIRADATGGTTVHFTGRNDAACATQHSFDAGLDVLFVGTKDQGTFELAIDDVIEGETGSDFPTSVSVTNDEGERWQASGCLTSISEHRLLEVEASAIGELRHYQVSGEGSCSDTLTPSTTGLEPVTATAFTFRSQFTWRD
jgi:hypothetical protein